MKKLLISIIVSFLFISPIFSQNIAITDDNSYTADPSAMLDIKSVTKGMLVPRMTSIQRTGIASPATGLLVYDTNEDIFYFYTGAVWSNLSVGQLWTKNGNYVYLSNTDDNVGIGVTNPNQKLLVKADASTGIDESIFAVLNNNGDTVFAVYQEGVRIWVDDNGGTKANGSRGGFAVGGFNPTKAGFTNEYLRVTPDSVRVYIDDSYVAAKANGSRGGFAVGGFNPTKGTPSNHYLFVQDDSTRVYVNDSTAGFGIASIESGNTENFLDLTTQNYFIGHQCGNINTLGEYNSFIGYMAGSNNTTGNNNSFFGYQAGFQNNSGSFNIFIGNKSGYTNTDGSYNTFVGFESGKKNTTGNLNTFIGRHAGVENTDASQNTFIGSFSGGNNTTGWYNSFLGAQSGASTTTGEKNVFVGTGAGYNNWAGGNNTYVGYIAGWANQSNYNTFIGCESGMYNLNAYNNVFIGYRAGYNNGIGGTTGTEACFNTFIGAESGFENTTGYPNTGVGYHSLYRNTTGAANTGVGHIALSLNTTGTHNTAVGHCSMASNTTGTRSTAIGTYTIEDNTTGYRNTAVGYSALRYNTTGYANTAIGYGTTLTGISYVNSTALGYFADPGASNTVRIGDASVTTIGGYANWTNVSDARFKTNIQENVVGLDFIMKLRPVTYNLDMDAIAEYNNSPDSMRIPEAERLKSAELQVGFIAQEVEKASNELGFDFHGVDKPKNETSHYGLRYAEFVVPLVKAIQDQQMIIEEYKTENNELRNIVDELIGRIEKLEKK